MPEGATLDPIQLHRLGGGLRSWLPPPRGPPRRAIRGPRRPLRLRRPLAPYRSGSASVGRLAGRGASTLSVRGLFGNGTLETGSLRPPPAAGPPDPPPSTAFPL